MGIYNIVKNGDPVLRKTAKEVKVVDDTVHSLIANMADTMYAAQGVGLAAPQVGRSKRVIVVDVGSGLYALVNPVITASAGEQDGPEGCLSCPGTAGNVLRAERVTISALDQDGKPVIIEAEGYLARAFQHEIDHLNGVLYLDKATDVLYD